MGVKYARVFENNWRGGIEMRPASMLPSKPDHLYLLKQRSKIMALLLVWRRRPHARLEAPISGGNVLSRYGIENLEIVEKYEQRIGKSLFLGRAKRISNQIMR